MSKFYEPTISDNYEFNKILSTSYSSVRNIPISQISPKNNEAGDNKMSSPVLVSSLLMTNNQYGYYEPNYVDPVISSTLFSYSQTGLNSNKFDNLFESQQPQYLVRGTENYELPVKPLIRTQCENFTYLPTSGDLSPKETPHIDLNVKVPTFGEIKDEDDDYHQDKCATKESEGATEKHEEVDAGEVFVSQKQLETINNEAEQTLSKSRSQSNLSEIDYEEELDRKTVEYMLKLREKFFETGKEEEDNKEIYKTESVSQTQTYTQPQEISNGETHAKETLITLEKILEEKEGDDKETPKANPESPVFTQVSVPNFGKVTQKVTLDLTPFIQNCNTEPASVRRMNSIEAEKPSLKTEEKKRSRNDLVRHSVDFNRDLSKVGKQCLTPNRNGPEKRINFKEKRRNSTELRKSLTTDLNLSVDKGKVAHKMVNSRSCEKTAPKRKSFDGKSQNPMGPGFKSHRLSIQEKDKVIKLVGLQSPTYQAKPKEIIKSKVETVRNSASRSSIRNGPSQTKTIEHQTTPVSTHRKIDRFDNKAQRNSYKFNDTASNNKTNVPNPTWKKEITIGVVRKPSSSVERTGTRTQDQTRFSPKSFKRSLEENNLRNSQEIKKATVPVQNKPNSLCVHRNNKANCKICKQQQTTTSTK